jgi:hypothetical protein
MVFKLLFKSNRQDPAYREVVTSPMFEVCQVVKFSTTNYFIKQFISSFVEAAPNIFKCPFIGEIEQKNFTLPYKSFDFLPSGFYQLNIQMFLNEKGKMTGKFVAECQIRNSLKDLNRN